MSELKCWFVGIDWASENHRVRPPGGQTATRADGGTSLAACFDLAICRSYPVNGRSPVVPQRFDGACLAAVGAVILRVELR